MTISPTHTITDSSTLITIMFLSDGTAVVHEPVWKPDLDASCENFSGHEVVHIHHFDTHFEALRWVRFPNWLPLNHQVDHIGPFRIYRLDCLQDHPHVIVGENENFQWIEAYTLTLTQARNSCRSMVAA